MFAMKVGKSLHECEYCVTILESSLILKQKSYFVLSKSYSLDLQCALVIVVLARTDSRRLREYELSY